MRNYRWLAGAIVAAVVVALVGAAIGCDRKGCIVPQGKKATAWPAKSEAPVSAELVAWGRRGGCCGGGGARFRQAPRFRRQARPQGGCCGGAPQGGCQGGGCGAPARRSAPAPTRGGCPGGQCPAQGGGCPGGRCGTI